MKRKREWAAVDYTQNMLPQTRKEVFFDVIKLHWFELLKIGGLLLIAFLPILTISVVNDAYEVQRMSQITGISSQEALREAVFEVYSFRNTSAWINIVCYLIFAVAFAGALRLIRQYAMEEVVFFWSDFLKGIRQNGRQILILALFMGIQNAIGLYLSSNGQFAQDKLLGSLGLIFNALSVFIFLPAWAYLTVLVAVYDNTFMQNLLLAFSLYANTLWKTIVILPSLGVLFLIGLLPNFICHVLGQVFGALLLPIALLIWMLFVFNQLDHYINPRFFPELTGKGLYREET